MWRLVASCKERFWAWWVSVLSVVTLVLTCFFCFHACCSLGLGNQARLCQQPPYFKIKWENEGLWIWAVAFSSCNQCPFHESLAKSWTLGLARNRSIQIFPRSNRSCIWRESWRGKSEVGVGVGRKSSTVQVALIWFECIAWLVPVHRNNWSATPHRMIRVALSCSCTLQNWIGSSLLHPASGCILLVFF